MAKQYDITIAAKDEATTVLRGIQGELSRVAKGAIGVVAAYAGVFSARKLIAFANEATEAYNAQTVALEGLSAALGGQRDAAEANAEYAASLQQITAVGDEVTLGIMRRATLLGVEQSQLKSVATATVGVAEATGLGLNEALRKVNETINGNARALGEYLPALKKTEDAEEQLRLVTELARSGVEQKIESLNRLDGAQAAARGAVGDLMESVGQLIAPFQIVVNQGIKVFAETAQNALAPAVAVASASIQNLGQWTTWAAEKAIYAVTAIETAYNNWEKITEIAVSTVALSFIGWSEDIKYVFTTSVPTYLNWFVDNWFRILVDWVNATNTIFENMAKNIVNIISELMKFISSGFEGGVKGLATRVAQTINTDLLDGFTSITKELPDIAGRKLTAEETALLNRIGKLGADLGQEFNTKFSSRMEGFKASLSQAKDIELDLTASVKANIDSDKKSLRAVEARLLTRGRADDPNAKIADNTKMTVEQLKKANEKLDKIKPSGQGDALQVKLVR